MFHLRVSVSRGVAVFFGLLFPLSFVWASTGKFIVTIQPSNSGTITWSTVYPTDSGTLGGGGGAFAYTPNQMYVSLVLYPNPDKIIKSIVSSDGDEMRFLLNGNSLYWSGSTYRTTNSLIVTFVDSNAPVTIAVQASPSNGGTVSGGGSYPVGTNVQITASANSAGWVFTGWSDGGSQTHNITVATNDMTYTALFDWVSSPADCLKLTTETYQDAVGYDSNKDAFIYPTGSFTINGVLFAGAGLTAANLSTNTPVEISIGKWSYQGANNTLSDDPGYKAKATKAKLPLTYQDSSGKRKPSGTLVLSFGKKNTTLTITSKAGQDAQHKTIQNFIVADFLTGGASIGKSITTNATISGTIRIGDYSESFTNIVITGTDAAKHSKAREGVAYRLDTVKIKGTSQ